MSDLELDIDDGIAVARLNRPESKNALSEDMLRELGRKKLMYQSLRTDLKTSLEMVSSHMAVVQSTSDYKEAITAYREKRRPKFEGR